MSSFKVNDKIVFEKMVRNIKIKNEKKRPEGSDIQNKIKGEFNDLIPAIKKEGPPSKLIDLSWTKGLERFKNHTK